MATGTKGGLLDGEDPKAQSVFKHKVLSAYLQPFMAMTGSTAAGRRVVVLDGFAGQGRYPGGTPASAELILKAMASLGSTRNLQAFFVEKDPQSFQRLQQVVDQYRHQGVRAVARNGEVEDHLAEVVAQAAGVPLFLFLDPCGAGVSFEQLAGVLTGPRARPRPVTEVLLNVNADLSRRVVGALRAGRDTQKAMDRACGGDWWRQAASLATTVPITPTFDRTISLEEAAQIARMRSSPTKLNYAAVADAVAGEYARRLGQATGMWPAVVPVFRKPGHQPCYHLVFFTRSNYGLWVFADAAAQARQEWLRYLGQVEDSADEKQGKMQVLPQTTLTENAIIAEAARLRDNVIDNLRRELATSGQAGFKLVNRPYQVFGDAYGKATEATVMEALKHLESAGEVEVIPGQGQRVRENRIRRAEFAQRPNTQAAG